MTQTRSWAEMLTAIEERLVRTTGEDVATWRDRVAATVDGERVTAQPRR